MNRNTVSRRLPPRHGAAFLIMVVMVSLVVLGATQSLVRNEILQRRGNGDWIRSQAMQAAIASSLRAEIDRDQTLRLPLDQSAEEYLEVRRNQVADGNVDSDTIVVRWIRRGEVIDQATRTIESADSE